MTLTIDYDRWRRELWGDDLLHEATEVPPPERLLQLIWQHQRLLRDRLCCSGGTSLQVLHPGFRNRGAGPDFLRAVIQFADEPPRSGDIEVDRYAEYWRDHGHDRNPAYRRVILQVVWFPNPPAPGQPPALALAPYLDTPLTSLSTSLAGEPSASEWVVGRCHPWLLRLSASGRDELIEQAARARFRSKATALEARALQVGWSQSLIEGLMAALGYRLNTWPMRRLGEILPTLVDGLAPGLPGAVHLQARLLGVAGLLPGDVIPGAVASGRQVRHLWDIWWREREGFAAQLMPRSIWRLGGVRPANHPQRRLALAAHWFANGDLSMRLERWFLDDLPSAQLLPALQTILSDHADEFWQKHWTLNGRELTSIEPLLGVPRTTDLAVNVILPWFWVRARAGANEALCRRAEQRFLAWPTGQDNQILKLARGRLLEGMPRRQLRGAAQQQGLLQIVHDFCDHADALCRNCPLPQHVSKAVGVVGIAEVAKATVGSDVEGLKCSW
jgi:hypothetical protein